jgi:hypothetical protein
MIIKGGHGNEVIFVGERLPYSLESRRVRGQVERQAES